MLWYNMKVYISFDMEGVSGIAGARAKEAYYGFLARDKLSKNK